MKSRLLLAGAFFSLLALACHRDHNSLTGPAPAATPTPAPYLTAWTVTVTSESITGDACVTVGLQSTYIPAVGAPWDVVRNGSSILLRYLPAGYPTDSTDYTGTLSGSAFVASRFGPLPPSSWTCAEGRTVSDAVQTEQISGSFSEDDRHFDAEEIETWRLPTGEEATARRHWTGTKL